MRSRKLWAQLRHVLGGYPTTAAEWAVRAQSADVTREELLVLDAWLKADPSHAEDYARVNKIGHLGLRLREQPHELARLTAYRELKAAELENARAQPLPARRWVAATAACSLVILGAIGFMAWSSRGAPVVAHHGEQKRVTLPDGSSMVVNTDSEARIRYSDAMRVIDLPRGEAFFEVTPDAAKPFIVRAGTAEIRAIGTRFSVRRDDGTTEVVVTEGRVRVSEGGSASSDLTSGNRIRLEAHAMTSKVSPVDAARAVLWTSGMVEFDDEPLERVVSEVNRYTQKSFVLADPALAGIRLTGRFRVGDMQSVRFALRDRFGIEAVDDGARVALTREP